MLVSSMLVLTLFTINYLTNDPECFGVGRFRPGGLGGLPKAMRKNPSATDLKARNSNQPLAATRTFHSPLFEGPKPARGSFDIVGNGSLPPKHVLIAYPEVTFIRQEIKPREQVRLIALVQSIEEDLGGHDAITADPVFNNPFSASDNDVGIVSRHQLV
jgi:hypothetical protein